MMIKQSDLHAQIDAIVAEIEARKKQYHYYREQLLHFENDKIEFKSLSELFILKNGYTPSKNNKDYWENGTIPWFRMDDLRKNGQILNQALQQITTDALKGGNPFPANSIIVATSATIGDHALITVPYLCNQRFTSLVLKEEFKNHFYIKFLFYYGFILCNWCKKHVNKAVFSSVDMKHFKNFRFPIPPLEEQERIVSILDKFDALVNDISSRLPAEIAAPRKQYEYYRNKLLTFEKKL